MVLVERAMGFVHPLEEQNKRGRDKTHDHLGSYYNPMCEFWRLKKEDGSRYLGKKMKVFESQEESHVDR